MPASAVSHLPTSVTPPTSNFAPLPSAGVPVSGSGSVVPGADVGVSPVSGSMLEVVPGSMLV
jgi:hypothetical protein